MLQPLIEAAEAIQMFIETGGEVLMLIFAVTLLMWTLILERLWYFRAGHPSELEKTLARWKLRTDQHSWYSEQVRGLLVSELSVRLRTGLPMIKTLVALCPLLGLLGTVTGMIEVFDVMAISGNGNVRAMAAGVEKATIPTMAGMVAALSGLYFSVRLERFANDETAKLADHLTSEA